MQKKDEGIEDKGGGGMGLMWGMYMREREWVKWLGKAWERKKKREKGKQKEKKRKNK